MVAGLGVRQAAPKGVVLLVYFEGVERETHRIIRSSRKSPPRKTQSSTPSMSTTAPCTHYSRALLWSEGILWGK